MIMMEYVFVDNYILSLITGDWTPLRTPKSMIAMQLSLGGRVKKV